MLGKGEVLLRRIIGFVMAGAALVVAGGAVAEGESARQDMLDDKESILAAIEAESFEEPVHVSSSMTRDTVRGEIHAVVDHSFRELLEMSDDLRAWCGITILHFNIKACVYDPESDPPVITLYTARMYYSEPEDAEASDFRFEVDNADQDFLLVRISGGEGPFNTYDYAIEMQAIPLGEERTLVEVSFSVSYGMLARWAQRVYFSTIGRHRIGFSATGEENGERQYVRGLRGMMERNTVRLHLALQAGLELPGEHQQRERFERWHELTGRYPDQLREMDEDTYLDNKRREFANQQALQQALYQRDGGRQDTSGGFAE